MKHILRTTCLAAALLTACAPIGENYQEPEIPVPDSWNQAIRTGLSTSSPEITSWWRKFNDPTLNKLISLSKSNNRELAIAAERITEARSQSKIARGGLSPFVAANGGVTRSRASESVSAFATNQDTYELGFSAGWEMDFVGGLRRSVEAARASAEATEELYHDTLVLIYAELASNYIQYRTLQRRIELAEANIGNQQKSVDLTRARKDAGLAPQIDVSQAETNLASSRALIPQLRTQQAATLNRIAVLIGSYPDQARRLLGTGSSIPTPPRSLATGLPSDLLRARPDIRAAERRVAAQHAALGVSKAELFPKFTLSGTLALQGANPGDLSDGASRAYSFGPGFRWRIFEGGIIKEEIKAQESRVRQALATYQQSVLEAVSDVETSLASIHHERERRSHLDQSVASARETVQLIKDNYAEGLVDFQNVLDAERTIFSNEDAAAASAGLLADSYVSLYRSLGGGTRMGSK